MDSILSKYNLSYEDWWIWIDIICRNKVMSEPMLELMVQNVVHRTSVEQKELEVVHEVIQDETWGCIVQ
jgi:hypothetical protein